MELHAYLADEEVEGGFYEDAGDGYGVSIKKTFKLRDQKLIQTRSVEFQPNYSGYHLTIHGAAWNKFPIDGAKEMPFECGKVFEIPECFKVVQFWQSYPNSWVIQ